MSARRKKGVRWFRFVMVIVGTVAVVKAISAFGYADPGKQLAMALAYLVGGALLFALPAFFLGWLSGEPGVAEAIDVNPGGHGDAGVAGAPREIHDKSVGEPSSASQFPQSQPPVAGAAVLGDSVLARLAISTSSNASVPNKWLTAAVVVILALIGLLVWPTPWRYDHLVAGEKTVPVRTHRITGEAQIFSGDGWSRTGEPMQEQLEAIPAGAGHKVEVRLGITDYDWIKADVYNGTERKLGEVRIRLIISGDDGVEVLNREYRLTSSGGQPLGVSEFIAKCGCPESNGKKFDFVVTRVAWTRE